MIAFFLPIFCLIAAVYTQTARSGKEICGTPTKHEVTRFNVQSIAADYGIPPRAVAPFTIDMYFHVIHAGDSLKEGNIPYENLMAQWEKINANFAPAGITFDLKLITRVKNPDWYGKSSYDKNMGREGGISQWYQDMKTYLHKGGYKTLNVYFTDVTDVLGSCSMPVPAGAEDRLLGDGCLIDSGTVPGGWEEQQNTGGVATHEIGHWLNLPHTFDKSCNGEGDGVDDTPAQKKASWDCGAGKYQTCTPGEKVSFEAAHNYMDYFGVDACRKAFTQGQIERMHSDWAIRETFMKYMEAGRRI